MLFDPLRSRPLVRAIGHVVKKGDVVIDIGTGLGVLAIAACRAGASRVYAIDVDEKSIAAAEIIAESFSVRDRITFVVGLSFDLVLDEKADVIICETIGSAAFDENILATLSDAKHRLLKKGGKIIPERVELWGTLRHATYHLTKATLLAAVDLRHSSATTMHAKQSLRVLRSGRTTSLLVWPRVTWSNNFITDAAPDRPTTHWRQTTLPLRSAAVRKGEQRSVELIIQPHPLHPEQQTEMLWRLRGGRHV